MAQFKLIRGGLFTGAEIAISLSGQSYAFTSAPTTQGVYTDAVLQVSHIYYYYGNFQDGTVTICSFRSIRHQR